MPLKDHLIKGRDKFEPNSNPGMCEFAFPCFACDHKSKTDEQEPCITCDYNMSAKKPDPASMAEDQVIEYSEIFIPLSDKDSDPVNHPDHYGGKDNPYEAIKVIEAWQLNFCLGNTVKYISRAGKKLNAIEDLKKARWYLDREIQNLEKKS